MPGESRKRCWLCLQEINDVDQKTKRKNYQNCIAFVNIVASVCFETIQPTFVRVARNSKLVFEALRFFFCKYNNVMFHIKK